MLQDLCLVRTDIIPIINKCWPPAFSDVENNKKAICKKGWNPYNRNLLLHPVIRATMTEDMLAKETSWNIFPFKRMPNLQLVEYVECGGKGNISVRSRVIDEASNLKLNFNGGVTTKFVSSAIMSDVDRQLARERNQKKRDEGKTLKERLLSITKHMTSGLMTLKARTYHLDKTVMEHAKEQKVVRSNKKIERRQEDDLEYLKLCFKADVAKKKNPWEDVKKWNSIKDIAAYLRPLQRMKEKSLPTSRKDIESCYIQYSSRRRLQLVPEQIVMEKFMSWLESDEAKKEGKSQQKKKRQTVKSNNGNAKKQKLSEAK